MKQGDPQYVESEGFMTRSEGSVEVPTCALRWRKVTGISDEGFRHSDGLANWVDRFVLEQAWQVDGRLVWREVPMSDE